MADNIKETVTKGLIWTFGERIAAQLVSTLVTIVLARILDPEHYGAVSIVTVLITFFNIFVVSGFGSAVIQKKDANDVDFNTAFIVSSAVSIVIYVGLFFAAPYIAEFYNMSELTWIVRVMALRLPIAAINNIQQARIRRNMEFRKFFIATLFGTVISGFVGIAMALKDLGAWALVGQYLTNSIIDTIMLFIVGDWRPRFQFSIKKAREIYGFGWKVLVTELIFTVQGDLRTLIIGKVFGAGELAYYDQGKKYPSLLVTNLNSSLQKVMLPAYSRYQSDIHKLKEMLRRSINICSYILIPILLGFASVSKEFVGVVLGDKWLNTVPYIWLFCIALLMRPLQSACHQAILAIGRSDTVLYIIIANNSLSFIVVLIAAFVMKNIMLVAVSSLVSEVISLIGFSVCSNRQLAYSYWEQTIDVIPNLAMGLFMTGSVYVVNLLKIKMAYILIIKVIIGFGLYVLLSKLLKLRAYTYLINTVKEKYLPKIFRPAKK